MHILERRHAASTVPSAHFHSAKRSYLLRERAVERLTALQMHFIVYLYYLLACCTLLHLSYCLFLLYLLFLVFSFLARSNLVLSENVSTHAALHAYVVVSVVIRVIFPFVRHYQHICCSISHSSAFFWFISYL